MRYWLTWPNPLRPPRLILDADAENRAAEGVEDYSVINTHCYPEKRMATVRKTEISLDHSTSLRNFPSRPASICVRLIQRPNRLSEELSDHHRREAGAAPIHNRKRY